MLHLFDLDGTIITGYLDNADKDYHRWELLPGRAARLARLARVGAIGIITNQGGVAFGYNTEEDFTTKIGRVAMLLGYSRVVIHDGRPDGSLVLGWGADALHVYVCYSDSRAKDARYRVDAHRRKPSGAMIREAIAAEPWHADDGALYVGDRPEDEAAARDAGVAFQRAEEFFQ